MTKTHIIKAWPEYWDALADGSKTFELRFADRPYTVGDVLEIHRVEQIGGNEERRGVQTYPPGETPAPLIMRVTYVLPGGLSFGGRVLLDPSAVIMGVKPAFAQDQDAKADKLMIEHLRSTLDSIRDTLAVEFKAGEPVRDVMLHHLIGLIDEALDPDA